MPLFFRLIVAILILEELAIVLNYFSKDVGLSDSLAQFLLFPLAIKKTKGSEKQ